MYSSLYINKFYIYLSVFCYSTVMYYVMCIPLLHHYGTRMHLYWNIHAYTVKTSVYNLY